MGNPVVTNLIKTGAILWYAPEGEAEPDETSVAAGAAWGGNWARVGYTKAPLTFAYETEESDITVEEVLAPVKRFKTSEGVTIETVLAEIEADYLALLAEGTVTDTAAGASQKGYEELPVGDDATPTVRHWGFEGTYIDSAGAEQPVRIFVARATAKVNGNLEFSKKSDGYPGIPIQLKGLADTGNSNQLFKFQRVTAAATS